MKRNGGLADRAFSESIQVRCDTGFGTADLLDAGAQFRLEVAVARWLLPDQIRLKPQKGRLVGRATLPAFLTELPNTPQLPGDCRCLLLLGDFLGRISNILSRVQFRVNFQGPPPGFGFLLALCGRTALLFLHCVAQLGPR